MKDIQLVVLDIVGTTIRDRGEVNIAFTHALAQHGIPVTEQQIHDIRGGSKRRAILSLIPDHPNRNALAEEIFASFAQKLKEVYRQNIEPMPDASNLFRLLRSLNIPVALNTGFDRPLTEYMLSLLGWDHRIVDAVITADDVKKGRPAPYMIFRAMEATNTLGVANVMNVGDTVLDLQAARNAGVGCSVGVYSGAHSKEQLNAVSHDRLLNSVSELINDFSEPDKASVSKTSSEILP